MTFETLRCSRADGGLSDDAKEGIAAFFDKRAPQWKGR